MRLTTALLAFALLAAGCASPSAEPADGQGAPAPGGEPGGPSLAQAPGDAPAVPVTDPVSVHGVIGAGACAFDGDSIECVNGPSATSPGQGANILRYLHERKGEVQGGLLTVTYTPRTGVGLSGAVILYEGCDDVCAVSQVLADGNDPFEPVPGQSATFTLEVPAVTVLANQTLGVRVAPRLVTGVASAHTGFEVDIEGSLDFLVPA